MLAVQSSRILASCLHDTTMKLSRRASEFGEFIEVRKSMSKVLQMPSILHSQTPSSASCGDPLNLRSHLANSIEEL